MSTLITASRPLVVFFPSSSLSQPPKPSRQPGHRIWPIPVRPTLVGSLYLRPVFGFAPGADPSHATYRYLPSCDIVIPGIVSPPGMCMVWLCGIDLVPVVNPPAVSRTTLMTPIVPYPISVVGVGLG